MAMANEKVLPQLQTLISIAALFVMVANMALSQTISFQIETFTNDQNELGVTYEGDATVPSGSTFLRLTEAETYRVGRVLYNEPFQFWGQGKQVEFETTIYLQISPTDNNPADGIVFFIAPEGYEFPDPPGSSGGNFGIFGTSGTGNSIFAVEIDTYQDPWDPYYRHIGIDINSRTSSSWSPLDDSVLGKEVAFTIKYDVAVNTITAKVQVGSSHLYEATYVYDLSTLLPETVQVGISAATGACVSVQDIYSWDFTATMKTVDGAGIRQVVST